MAYHRPFTLPQRRDAVQAYRSYRRHQLLLRRKYPPRNTEQRQVLASYIGVLDEVADELRKADRAVDVDALNRADAQARWLALEYWQLRNQEG